MSVENQYHELIQQSSGTKYGWHTECLQPNYDGDMFLFTSLCPGHLDHFFYVLLRGNTE